MCWESLSPMSLCRSVEVDMEPWVFCSCRRMSLCMTAAFPSKYRLRLSCGFWMIVHRPPGEEKCQRQVNSALMWWPPYCHLPALRWKCTHCLLRPWKSQHLHRGIRSRDSMSRWIWSRRQMVKAWLSRLYFCQMCFRMWPQGIRNRLVCILLWWELPQILWRPQGSRRGQYKLFLEFFLLLSCWIFPVLYLFSPSKWLVGLTCKVYQTRWV